jgi:hypothetical protein
VQVPPPCRERIPPVQREKSQNWPFDQSSTQNDPLLKIFYEMALPA